MRHTLLLALPASASELQARLREPEVGDAVRMWAHERDAADGDALWRTYRKVANAMDRAEQQVAAAGAAVVRRATRAALREALQDDGAVLTLVAHWKGARVYPFDLRHPQAIVSALGRHAQGERLLVRQLLGPARIESLLHRPEALAEALDLLVVEQDFDPVPAYQADDADELREARNRAWLEAQFPGALCAGNRLELWDGMISAADFIAAVPLQRRAAIDLAVCHSTVLGRGLQFARDCPLLINRRPAGIVFRLALHALAVEDAVRHGAEYIESVFRRLGELDPAESDPPYQGSFA